MSNALIAIILLTVDAHVGHWVPAAAICRRIAMHQLAVLDACLQLVEACQLQTREIGGEPHFGVRVDAQSPAVTVNEAVPA